METKIIGNKIAEARKKINISQATLAQQLFISAQAVGKWERGESIPDIITFNRLAKILGVDLNYFSDNFQSTIADTVASDDTIKLTDEMPSEPDNKISWDMSRGNWVDADFSGLKNLHQKFSSSNILRCLFVGSDLSRLLLKNNNVDSCNFSGSDFGSSRILNSNLSNNIFKDCSLLETEFNASNISGCDFNGADFTGVLVKSGGFSGVTNKKNGVEKNTIANAVWNRTAFINTYLADIVFEGTLNDCYFENCAFTRVAFRNARLINTFFKNKSLKRVSFINCQADRITYAFLKNGKADLSGITLLEE